MSETSPPPGQAVEQQLAAALGLSLQHPAAQPSPSSDNETVLLETLTRSKTLEKEMCSVFSKYMDAIKASSTVDLNELVREKMERCKELEQQLGEVKHSLGETETALQKLRNDHTELEKRRVSEVESVRCSMDDMFKDSLAEWEARIKHAEGERDKALEEAAAAKQQAHEIAAKERGLCDKAERELEGVRLELSAMHEAMASLHGEMGAMQRELDSNGEREAGLRERADKAERVLGSVKAERETIEEDKKRVEAELSSLKQAARAAMLELASQRQKRDAEVASLTKEVEGLRGELTGAQEQGSRASAANADAARALEAVQEELDKERRENRDKDKELAEAQARGKEADDARTQLTEALSASESRCGELEGRATRALEDARTLRTQLDGAKTQQRALQQEVQRLETEKHDLIFDGQQRLEQGLAVQDELDALRSKLDKVIESQKALEAERDAMAQREREAKLKVEEASLEVKEMRGSLAEAERERDEALQQKRDVGESAKAGQRESAARIVEFSQKNAKLLADVTQLRGSLSEAEQERDELRAAAAGAEKDGEEAKEQAKQLWDKIQGLEEELEEVRMKKEAVDAQLSGLRETEIRERQDWEGQHRKAQELHRREMEDLRKTVTEDAERRVAKAEAMRLETERMCERSLVKTRDGMKRQLEEVNGARQREVNEARSKAAALGSALDDLNRELREEEKKNAGLRDEIAQLHRLVGSHAQFSNGEVKPYGDLCKENDGLRREVMHLRGSHEAALADVHRQLASATQARQQHEQGLEEQRERVRLLERDSQSLQQTLSKSERETQSLRMSLQQAQQQVSALQRSVTDADARVEEAVRGKDQEIERLSRRNRVLQDAISRISHETSTEHAAPCAYPPPQIDPPSPFPATHGHSSSSGSLLIPGSEARYTPHPPHNSPPPLLAHSASFLASPTHNPQSSGNVLYGADAWMAAGVAVGSGYHERPPTIPTRPNNVGPMLRHAAGTQAYDARRPPGYAYASEDGYAQERAGRRGEGMGPDSLDESLQAHVAGTQRGPLGGRQLSGHRARREESGEEEEDDGGYGHEGTVGLESRESNGDLAASIGASNGRRFQEAALRILASAESTLRQPMAEPQEGGDWEEESQPEEEEEEESEDEEEEQGRRGGSSGALLSGRRPREFSPVVPPQAPKPKASKVVKRTPQGQQKTGSSNTRRRQASDGGASKAYGPGAGAVSGAGRAKPSPVGERQARRAYR